MHFSSQNVRIVSAVVIAVAMIGISFWLSSSSPKLASALSTDELLRAYVEQDTDDDGLPDWQEEVYGTDPGNPRSVDSSMTDLEALKEGLVEPVYVSETPTEPVPPPYIPGEAPSAGSLTERFSNKFAEAYFAAGGGTNISDAEQQQIVTSLLSVFVDEAGASLASSYTSISIRTDAAGSVTAYADSLATILTTNDVPAEMSDPVTLAGAIIQGDATEMTPKLNTLSNTYGNITKELLALPAPSDVIDAHLTLTRSFDTLSRATRVLPLYESDPITALGGLSVLEPSAKSVVSAFHELAVIILRDGEPQQGSGAALIVQIARSAQQP